MVTPNTGATPSMSGQSVGAVIVAAGHSRRMDGVDKTLAPLMGRPLIAHSLQAFNDSLSWGPSCSSMSPQNIRQGRRLVAESGWNKVSEVCTGGERRQDSVRRGLEAMPRTDWTVVHDGARPWRGPGDDRNGPGKGPGDRRGSRGRTGQRHDKVGGPDLVVTGTIKREGLWAAQTPPGLQDRPAAQGPRGCIRGCHRRCRDGRANRRRGDHIHGSPHNIKVTTPEDIPIAEAVLKTRA